jgi:hypothetical protein
VIGAVERIEDRVRFIPSVFWQHRGFSDWMVTVTGEEQDGRWLRLTTPDGTVILRHRRTA